MEQQAIHISLMNTGNQTENAAGLRNQISTDQPSVSSSVCSNCVSVHSRNTGRANQNDSVFSPFVATADVLSTVNR